MAGHQIIVLHTITLTIVMSSLSQYSSYLGKKKKVLNIISISKPMQLRNNVS